jgi:anhydro-N-acetylmuramic acid kinase
MLHTSLQKLYQSAQKSEKLIIGLMSGTSLDGLDIALCRFGRTQGKLHWDLLEHCTWPYPQKLRKQLQALCFQKNSDLQALTLMHCHLPRLWAAQVQSQIQKWRLLPENIDLLASHGQTVFHAPQRVHGLPTMPHASLQIGDADHLAKLTGIITLSDFRQQHLAAGGEGAPLAPYGDYLLFGLSGAPRVLINIGGIANITYLPASANAKEVLASDVGPGNTLIDIWVQHYRPKLRYDPQGSIALQGQVHRQLLDLLLQEPFFAQALPKSIGQELFGRTWVESCLAKINENIAFEDLVATLSMLTVEALRAILVRFPADTQFFVSGGGVHNVFLMQYLEAFFPGRWQRIEALGLAADAKEALIFALLAHETVFGEALALGNMPPLTFGKLSFP